MKIKIHALDQDWDVNSISRKDRRELHGWNQAIFIDSEWEVVDGKPSIRKLNADIQERRKLLDKVLSLAFGGNGEVEKILDDQGISDIDQDVLAEKILLRYFNMSPKTDGD